MANTGPSDPKKVKRVKGFKIPVGKSIAKAYKITGQRAITPAGQLYEVESLKGKGPGVLMVFDPNVSVDFRRNALPKHPNIVPAMASISKDGVPRYVITGPTKGESLSKVLERRGPMHPGPAASATLQLLSALGAIHAKDCHHGNLNPESVTLSTDTDGSMEISLMHHGSVSFAQLPTDPSFLSPEQILGEGNVDSRSDQWSVGVILYLLVYGRLPFTGEDKDETSGKILLKDPGFPAEERIPQGLREIVQKSLEKDPADRYEDVASMVGDLMLVHDSFDDTMSTLVREALRKSVPPPPLEKKSDPQPKLAPKLEPEQASKPALKSVPKAAPKPVPKKPAANKTMLGVASPFKKSPVPKSKPQLTTSEPKRAPKPEPRTLPKPAPKTAPKPAPKTAPKPALKTAPKPAPKTAPKPATKKPAANKTMLGIAAPTKVDELPEHSERSTLPTPPKPTDLAATADSSFDLDNERPTTPVPEEDLERLKREGKPLTDILPGPVATTPTKPKAEPQPEPSPPPPVQPVAAKPVTGEAPLETALPPATASPKGEPSGYSMLADELEDTNDIDTTELPGAFGDPNRQKGRKTLVLIVAGAAFLCAAIAVLILVIFSGEDSNDDLVNSEKVTTPSPPPPSVDTEPPLAKNPQPPTEPQAPAVQAVPAVEDEEPEEAQATSDSVPRETQRPIGSQGWKPPKGGTSADSPQEEEPTVEAEKPQKPKPRRKKEGAWASNPFGG